MLTTIILISLVLYVTSRVYSSITGKKPNILHSQEDVKGAFSKISGAWWWLLPVSSFLIMLWEGIISCIWIVGEIVSLISVCLKWVWYEIIIAGAYFIFKQVWHYAVTLPWSFIVEGFRSLKDAANWSKYKTATAGLFITLLIVFFNEYISSHSEDKGLISKMIYHLINIASLIPVGISMTILNQRKKGNYNNIISSSVAFLKGFCWIIIPTALLTSALFLAIKMGLYTHSHILISGFVLGINLASSLFLLLSFILCIFLLSALPQVVTNNDSDSNFYRTYFDHLKNGGLFYLLSIPATIIPSILLCLLPLLATKGSAELTKKFINNRYENENSKLTSSVSSYVADYDKWNDYTKTTDEQLATLMATDKKMKETSFHIESLERQHAYLNQQLKNYANEYGAMPIAASQYVYDYYTKLTHINKFPSVVTGPKEIGPEAADLATMKTENAKTIQGNIDLTNATISDLETEKSKVCVEQPKEEQKEEPKVTKENPVSEEPKIDECELKRKFYQDQIDQNKVVLTDLQKQLDRNNKILSYAKDLEKSQKAWLNTEKSSRNAGQLLIGMWLCLLTALGFAFFIVIFNNLNGYAYSMVDDSDTYLVANIKSAHAANPNQPILGLGLTILLIGFLASNSPWKNIINKVNSTDKVISIGQDQIIRLDSTKQKTMKFTKEIIGFSEKN